MEAEKPTDCVSGGGNGTPIVVQVDDNQAAILNVLSQLSQQQQEQQVQMQNNNLALQAEIAKLNEKINSVDNNRASSPSVPVGSVDMVVSESNRDKIDQYKVSEEDKVSITSPSEN